jgi:hypothetical protein
MPAAVHRPLILVVVSVLLLLGAVPAGAHHDGSRGELLAHAGHVHEERERGGARDDPSRTVDDRRPSADEPAPRDPSRQAPADAGSDASFPTAAVVSLVALALAGAAAVILVRRRRAAGEDGG